MRLQFNIIYITRSGLLFTESQNMQLDLFDATITLDDVELWLRTVPLFDDTTAPSRALNYIETFDVYNKIITAKHNKYFYQLIVIDKQNLSRALLPLIKPKYRPCPHIPFSEFQKRLRSEAKI